MTKVTITPASVANMGKEDEIGHLHLFANQFTGTDSYLGYLLTPEFIAWMERQIKDDSWTDLFGEYNKLQAEEYKLADEYSAMETKYKKEVAQHEKNELDYVAEIARLQTALNGKNQVINNMMDDINRVTQRENAKQNALDAIEELTKDAWIRDDDIKPEQIRKILADLNRIA